MLELGHIGLTVSNIENSVEFYKTFFGCEEGRKGEITSEIIERFPELYNLEKNNIGKTCILRLPNNILLELFEFSKSMTYPDSEWNKIGYHHIAFNVDNVEELLIKARNCNAYIEGSFAVRPFDKGKRFFMKDMDDNLIEVMEEFTDC